MLQPDAVNKKTKFSFLLIFLVCWLRMSRAGKICGFTKITPYEQENLSPENTDQESFTLEGAFLSE